MGWFWCGDPPGCGGVSDDPCTLAVLALLFATRTLRLIGARETADEKEIEAGAKLVAAWLSILGADLKVSR